MKNLDYSICRYIAENDRNSDIMEVWEEYQDGEIDNWGFIEILQNVLGGWKEDLEVNGMTKREKAYYEYLGI